MTKSEMVQRIADEANITRAAAEASLNALVNIIGERFSAGEETKVHKLGSFKPTVRSPRKARNPHTGAPIDVPSRTVLVFKPSSELKAP